MCVKLNEVVVVVVVYIKNLPSLISRLSSIDESKIGASAEMQTEKKPKYANKAKILMVAKLKGY